MQTLNRQSSHLIFGAGLIGGFMAGAFASKGLSVSVVGRASMRPRFEDDFTVTDYHGHQAIVNNIRFISTQLPAQAISPSDFDYTNYTWDYVWLTVKCTGIEQAIVDLEPFVSDSTVIFCCQNGLGSHELVSMAFPNNDVRRAIMVSNVVENSMSHLHRGSQGGLLIESVQHPCGSLNVADLVASDLLEARCINNIDAYSWSKLQLNLANAINALADIPVKAMLEQRAYRQIIALLMQELIDVAKLKNIELPKLASVPMRWVPKVLKCPNSLFGFLGTKMLDIDPTVRTSMWWDINAGRKTEVDFINGAVVKQGALVGLNCPVNKKIVALIHQLESSPKRTEFCAKTFLASL